MSLKKIHNNKYYSETLSNMVSVSRKKYKLNLLREAENYAKIAMLISPANLDALYVAALFIKTNDNIIRRINYLSNEYNIFSVLGDIYQKSGDLKKAQ